MSRFFLLLCATLLLTAAWARPREIEKNSSITSERRLALVVGNKDYARSGASLSNAGRDADSMTAVLETLGFTVIKKKNLDYRTLTASIDAFGRQLKNYDVGLFYYSGHGLQQNGENYLVPTDEDINSGAEIEYQCVRLGRVFGTMEGADNKVNLVILDACRNNPFLKSTNKSLASSGLTIPHNPPGSFVAFATRDGNTADDNPTDQNSLFTAELLKQLRQPGLSLRAIMDKTVISVRSRSNGKQIPSRYDELEGDFVFLQTVAPASRSAVAVGKLKGVIELGASGFNSFIVRIDNQKRWQLEKSEFGNSLVLENMASDLDIREGLKRYIAKMLDFGVMGRDIHFVVSSGALKAEVTQKIIRVLKSLNYVVNTVTPEQEGRLGLKAVLPDSLANQAFVADIGSGNTKISWIAGEQVAAAETYGSKYFQDDNDDVKVYNEVKSKAKSIPSANRKVAYLIGGIPFELAKQIRKGEERYTTLKDPADYTSENAKQKAGLNIYKAIADATGCEKFIFDWHANFTIGYLLTLK